MSDRDEDFLARWSRRKRAARSVEAQAPDEAARAAGAAEAEPDPQGAATVPAATEPPEPLPSLDELTAEGDLVAFLREGVPAALRNAAMRKMWSLDPAIRDYVGPAEYAWDFNQPGSMAGFGALEAGRSSVADLLSTVRSVVPARPEGASKASEAPEPPRQVGEPVQPPDVPAEPGPADVTVAVESSETEPSGTSPRRRHGGALPR